MIPGSEFLFSQDPLSKFFASDEQRGQCCQNRAITNALRVWKFELEERSCSLLPSRIYFTHESGFRFFDVFSGSAGVPPASRRSKTGTRRRMPAFPSFAGRIPGAAAQLWMMSWMFSGRSLATSATMSPRSSLTIELRCGAPSISMSTPSVAAMSMMVTAGFSLTA